jgi:hypothetical protein
MGGGVWPGCTCPENREGPMFGAVSMVSASELDVPAEEFVIKIELSQATKFAHVSQSGSGLE